MPEGRTCPNCGAPLPLDALPGHCPACLLQIGLTLGGNDLLSATEQTPESESPTRVRYFGDYELLEQIAQGGMGVVYRARQVSLNRLVALKMIRAGELANEGEVARFRAEAEAAANLDHPNIVPIYEVGEHEGRHYFSMKLVEGGSLAQPSPESGVHSPKSADATARLLATVARAVHYAHQRGILHRDLKPGNILIDPQGEPHVTDFGLAKRMEADSSMTLSGVILGTPSYIAPEQAAGTKVLTTAADIYSLGAILYELLAGRPPFCGATALETLIQVREQEPKSPRAINPRIDRDLETICLECLEKNPMRRYGSAEALAEELERWLAHEPIQARPATVPERVRKWAQRRPAIAALVVALFLVALLGLAGIVWQWWQAEVARGQEQEQRQRAEENLWKSYLAQARAGRLSSVAGHRVNSLAAISNAARIKPSVELRTEAIACLALPDIGEQTFWLGREEVPTTAGDVFPDERFERFAYALPTGKVTVLRRSDRQTVAEFDVPGGPISQMRFSRDGRFLAIGITAPALRVWDFERQQFVWWTNCPSFEPGGSVIQFTPDSRALALAASDQRLHVLDLNTGLERASVDLGVAADRLRFDESGENFAVKREGEVAVWSLASRRRLASFTGGDTVTDLTWHPAGKRLAIGFGQGEVALWDWTTDVKQLWHAHNSQVGLPGFDQRGDLLLSMSHDGTTRVWDGETGRAIFTTQDGFALGFNAPENELWHVRERLGIGAWRFHHSAGFQLLRFPWKAYRFIWSAELSPNGRLAAGRESDGWHLWDVRSGRAISFHPSGHVGLVHFNSDGKWVWTMDSGTLRRWPLLVTNDATGVRVGTAEVFPVPGAQGGMWGVVSRDERTLTVATKRAAWVVDLGNGSVLGSITNDAPNLNYVAFSPDKQWLVTGTWQAREVTSVWELKTGRRLRELDRASSTVTFSPDGRTLVTCNNREYVFWDTATWQARHRVIVPQGSAVPGPSAFTSDGALLAIAPTRTHIKLLDSQSGEEVASLISPERQNIVGLTFSQDGHQLLASTESLAIQVWDLRILRHELATIGLDWEQQNAQAK